MNDLERAVVTGAANVLTDALLVDDLAKMLTCTEAESLAQLIGLVKDERYTQLFIRAHSASDSDEEDMHHDLFLRTSRDRA